MNRVLLAGGAAGLIALGAIAAALGLRPEAHDTHGQIPAMRAGLMSSLPIYRAPQTSVAEALSAAADEPHWLREALERRGTLAPMDALDERSLEGLDMLLLVQPRALTPTENVALDEWVRGGGRVLLVADPMLSGEPSFALGDPRNPQAIAVTAPILARWGLTLEADPSRPGMTGDGAARTVSLDGHTLPVVLGGRFAKRPPAGGAPADCAFLAERLIARCAVGNGQVVAIADATLFEGDHGHQHGHGHGEDRGGDDYGGGPGSGDVIPVFRYLLGLFRDDPEG